MINKKSLLGEIGNQINTKNYLIKKAINYLFFLLLNFSICFNVFSLT